MKDCKESVREKRERENESESEKREEREIKPKFFSRPTNFYRLLQKNVLPACTEVCWTNSSRG